MGFRLPSLRTKGKQASQQVPKGYFAVYVGEMKKRFVVPISYLNLPPFQEMLCLSEEEFGYDHPTGGLTIPCCENTFTNLLSLLNVS